MKQADSKATSASAAFSNGLFYKAMLLSSSNKSAQESSEEAALLIKGGINAKRIGSAKPNRRMLTFGSNNLV